MSRKLIVAMLLGGATLTSFPGCQSRDCAEERAGEQRCVGNRIETCNADGTLTYESCSAKGLVCSEEILACVTEEVAMSGAGGGGGQGGLGGAGGAGGIGGG